MHVKPTYKELLQRVRELEQKTREYQRTEKALRESEQKWKRMFDESPIGAAIVTDGYHFAGVNREFCRFTGYSEKELLALKFTDITHPDDLDFTLSESRKLSSGQVDQFQVEKRYLRKDGRIAWGRVSVRLIRDASGDILYSLPLIEDITNWKKAEEALLESEQKYRELFEKSLDAIFISGRDGLLLDANPAALELFGYHRREAVKKLNTKQVYLAPGNRQSFQDVIEEEGFVRNYSVQFRKKNNEIMDCLLTAAVHRDRDGNISGYHGIIRDVTDFKVAEKALLESEARYRAIVEDQTEMICRFLPNRTLTFVNQAYCRYFGRKPKELIGCAFMTFILEEDQLQVEESLRGLTPENPVVTYEHRVRTPGGEIRWQQWTSRMLLDAQDHTIEFQGVGRDITEKKLIEEELRESSEKIKLFAYSILHDLKSPVIGIYGLSKLLEKKSKDFPDPQIRRYSDQIRQGAEKITLLVDQINIYIATKEAPLNLELVSLKEILQMVREEYSSVMSLRQIKWLQPKRLPKIKADRLCLVRVLRNLADNALKYGGDGLKEIKIGYQADKEQHILSVFNDGRGIPLKDSGNLFNLFFREKSSKGTEGSGLGLAIVKEIAERHGGKVWFESPKSKGATFFISISKKL